MRKTGICLEKEITHGTIDGYRKKRKLQKQMDGMDEIMHWTGMTMVHAIRVTGSRESSLMLLSTLTETYCRQTPTLVLKHK